MHRFLTARVLRRALAVFGLLGLIGVGVWLAALHFAAEHHLRKAEQALTRQRYRSALGELQQVLRYRPRSGRLYLLAGRVARQSGNFSLAWDYLHRSRELEKGVSAELQLEEFLLRAQQGEVEQVYPYLVGYLRAERPETPLVLEALSHAYLFTFQLPRAAGCLQRWLELQPDNVEALLLRGTYYALNANILLATQELRHALELDPEQIAARVLLAQTLQDSHRPEKGLAEYRIVLQQEPTNFPARLGVASCLVDMSRWDEARPLVEELYREKPERPEITYLQGRIAETNGDYENAVHFLKASLAANPNDHVACYHLVHCYQRQGDDQSANEWEEHLDRVEKDQARMIHITTSQSETLATNPALCCELGEICLRLGITQRGLYWLHTAARLNPQYRRAHERLLDYYQKLGAEGEKEAEYHRQQLRRLKETESRP